MPALPRFDSLRASVVVPSYRRTANLEKCLRSLAEQSVPPLEVVVVLRAEDAGSRELAAHFPSARIATVREPGQVAALNCGCDAARGEVIAITDDDARPRPDWIERILSRFETDTRIGAVGGRDVVHFGDWIDGGEAARVGRVSWWGRRIGNHHLQSGLQDVDFLKGANMAFRAAAQQPFDTLLRGEGAQVCNDLEATWSVRRRGWRVVYDPLVIVDHYPAPRHDDDARDARSRHALHAEEHNEVYALMRHAPRWQATILLLYRLLIGKRLSPGLLLALRSHAWSKSGRTLVAGLVRTRLSALSTLRAARESRQSPGMLERC